MSKNYDPRLREAAQEFDAICRKYDCIGVALLVSPTHSEYLNNLEASWSLMRLDGSYLRMRSKREDFTSKVAQDTATAATAHAITSIFEWSRRTHNHMCELLKMLQKHMRIGWKVWGDQPDSYPGDGT